MSTVLNTTPALKYDSVSIKKADGTEELVSAATFAAMPITERVRLVSNGLVRFFKDGKNIAAVDALRK